MKRSVSLPNREEAVTSGLAGYGQVYGIHHDFERFLLPSRDNYGTHVSVRSTGDPEKILFSKWVWDRGIISGILYGRRLRQAKLAASEIITVHSASERITE